jgi:stage V sporulation protein SpoVS
MPPAAATAAARRITTQPAEYDSYSEAYTKRSGQATHTTHAPRAPRRIATVGAPPAPRRVASVAAPARPAPQRPRPAPARPRTAPHTAPAPARRPRTAAPDPRPIRIERLAPRSLRVERPAPRAGLIVRLPRAGKLLDSIVRGRAWIPVLGVLLVGIVGMRVEVLKLGSSVGTDMQQASVLQSANAVKLEQVSALSDNQRIEQLAEKRGMVMPLPLDLHFVQASGATSVNRAIADIREPSPTTFLAGLKNERVDDGDSVVAAEQTSAIGVQGGGSISSGATGSNTSNGTDQTTTTLSAAPPGTAGDTTAADNTAAGNTAADNTAGAGASDTQTQSSTSTADTQGTVAPPPASTASQGTASSTPGSTDSSTSGTAGGTGNAPPVTSTGSNGASNLAG